MNCRVLLVLVVILASGECWSFSKIIGGIGRFIGKCIPVVGQAIEIYEKVSEVLEDVGDNIRLQNKLDVITSAVDRISNQNSADVNRVIRQNKEGVQEIFSRNKIKVNSAVDDFNKQVKNIIDNNNKGINQVMDQNKENVRKIIENNNEVMNHIMKDISLAVGDIIDQNEEGANRILANNEEGVKNVTSNNNKGVKLMIDHFKKGVNETIANNKQLEKNVMTEISDVNQKINRMDDLMDTISLASKLILHQDIASEIRSEVRLDNLLELVSQINFASRKFQEYTEMQTSGNGSSLQYERYTLESFATYVVSHSPDSVHGLMHRIHLLIRPDISQNIGVLTEFAKYLQKTRSSQGGPNPLCEARQSPQQLVHSLYNTLQLAQLKGYAMKQFSWKLLQFYNKGNYTLESTQLTELFSRHMVEQAQSLKEALKQADSAYWRCDPQVHEEGKTYLQVKKFLQGYLQNTVNFYGNSVSCVHGCNHTYKTNPWTAQGSCYKDDDKGKLGCPLQDACSGQLLECQSTTSDMSVCYANLKTSSRTYEWIKNGDNGYFGNHNRDISCHEKRNETGFWRTNYCSLCFCLCAYQETSEITFSLRNVSSTIDKNNVLTGIRFVKHDKVFQIQIQEGLLEKHGSINKSSVFWKPVDTKAINRKDSHEFMDLKYNSRSINFDDLVAPPEHVITVVLGVKFGREGSHLKLEIRVTPFNFTSGQLVEGGKGKWINAKNSPVRSTRRELHLKSPHSPLYADTQSVVDSRNNTFIQFTHSDVQKDAAQTAVPFLDAQPVAPHPPVPLAGVGLYHKGQKGFGGFVGLKVFTYDYGHHIDAKF